jgi:hypothetical protein
MRTLGESGDISGIVSGTQQTSFSLTIFSLAVAADFSLSTCMRAAMACSSFYCKTISSSIIWSMASSCRVCVQATAGKSFLILM